MDTFSWIIKKFSERSQTSRLWGMISEILNPHDLGAEDMDKFLEMVKAFSNGRSVPVDHPLAKVSLEVKEIDTDPIKPGKEVWHAQFPLTGKTIKVARAVSMFQSVSGARVFYSSHRSTTMEKEMIESIIAMIMKRADLKKLRWSASHAIQSFPKRVNGNRKSWKLLYHNFMTTLHIMVALGLARANRGKERMRGFIINDRRCWRSTFRKTWRKWEEKLTAPTVEFYGDDGRSNKKEKRAVAGR